MVLRERRQVHELPVVRLVVTEQQALHVRCSACGQVSVGAFPLGGAQSRPVRARVRVVAVYLVEQQLVPLGRVQQLLADLFGLRLARGTLGRRLRTPAGVPGHAQEAGPADLRRAVHALQRSPPLSPLRLTC